MSASTQSMSVLNGELLKKHKIEQYLQDSNSKICLYIVYVRMFLYSMGIQTGMILVNQTLDLVDS